MSQYATHFPPQIGRHRFAPRPPAGDDGSVALASRRPEYDGETRDASSFRGPAQNLQHLSNMFHNGARLDAVRTRYFDPREQSRSEISIEDGLLKTRSGEALDTRAATGYGTMGGSGAGKHIFALTPDSTLRATDPWEGRQFNKLDPSQSDPRAPVSLDLVNHSSLVAGGRVAGAGEITAEEGRLQQISDASGHYRPDGRHMRQSLEHFQERGVDTHDVAVRFIPKADGDRPLIASSREFEAERDPAVAEARMRDRRARLGQELADAVGRREARRAIPNQPPVQYTDLSELLRGGQPIASGHREDDR